MSGGAPYFSVILPVCNAAPFLDAALESLRGQLFSDFEVIACDDASDDDSHAILERWRSNLPMTVLANRSRSGPAHTRNVCCEKARGEILAFFDADDISVPNRLQLQREHFVAARQTAIHGGLCREIDEQGREGAVWGYRGEPGELRARLMFENAFSTATVAIPRRWWGDHARFDPQLRVASDYDFWLRVLEYGEAVITPDILAKYRIHAANLTAREKPYAEESICLIQKAHLERVGVESSAAEMAIHRALARGRFESSRDFVVAAEAWLLKLCDRLKDRPGFAVRPVAGDYWYSLCFCCADLGKWLWQKHRESPLTRLGRWPLRKRLALWMATARGRGNA